MRVSKNNSATKVHQHHHQSARRTQANKKKTVLSKISDQQLIVGVGVAPLGSNESQHSSSSRLQQVQQSSSQCQNRDLQGLLSRASRQQNMVIGTSQSNDFSVKNHHQSLKRLEGSDKASTSQLLPSTSHKPPNSSRSISLHKKISQNLAAALQNCQIKGTKMTIEDQASSSILWQKQQQRKVSAETATGLSGSQSQVQSSSSQKRAKLPDKRQLIAIKILNGDKQVIETFIADKSLIVSQMKYFAKQLQTSIAESNQQIVDIQVCCDAKIFKFLLDYCTELYERGTIDDSLHHLKLSKTLLFPVLVSSVFLQIDDLIEECVAYWAAHFEAIVREQRVRVPLTQLDNRIFTQMCERVRLERLLKLESDPTDLSKSTNSEVLERMYTYHAYRLLDEESFTTCQFCAEIYPSAHANKLKCSATHDFFVDNSQQAIQMHVADRQLDLKRLCEYLVQEEGLSWRLVFAKILARSILLPRCSTCLDQTSAAFLQSCNRHTLEPRFKEGAHIGVYPCCGQHVIRAAYEQLKDEVTRLKAMQQSELEGTCGGAPSRAVSGGTQDQAQSTGTATMAKTEVKACQAPLGCKIQDHIFDRSQLTRQELTYLDFLQSARIAAATFEKRTSDILLKAKTEPAFAYLVTAFRNEMVDLISDRSDYLSALERALGQTPRGGGGSGAAVKQRQMLDYAIGGIIEQFEDDFDSEDSDFAHLLKRADDSKMQGSSTQASNSNGFSRKPQHHQNHQHSSGQNHPQKPASVEQALLANWNVKTLTRKKVRFEGKSVHYSFKFNMPAKQLEAGKLLTKRRDERLRNQTQENQGGGTEAGLAGAQTGANPDLQLAIPSNKELFVRRMTLSQFSKSNIASEMSFCQKTFDAMRMDKLASQMFALRVKEPKLDSTATPQPQPAALQASQQKAQKSGAKVLAESAAYLQKQAVNRLAVSKETYQQKQARMQLQQDDQMQVSQPVLLSKAILIPPQAAPVQTQTHTLTGSASPKNLTSTHHSAQKPHSSTVAPIAVQSFTYYTTKQSPPQQPNSSTQVVTPLSTTLTATSADKQRNPSTSITKNSGFLAQQKRGQTIAASRQLRSSLKTTLANNTLGRVMGSGLEAEGSGSGLSPIRNFDSANRAAIEDQQVSPFKMQQAQLAAQLVAQEGGSHCDLIQSGCKTPGVQKYPVPLSIVKAGSNSRPPIGSNTGLVSLGQQPRGVLISKAPGGTPGSFCLGSSHQIATQNRGAVAQSASKKQSTVLLKHPQQVQLARQLTLGPSSTALNPKKLAGSSAPLHMLRKQS